MHPADVAEHVATSVGEISERIARYPNLNVTAVELPGPFALDVRFEKKDWEVVGVILPSRLQLPGGAGIGYQVPDLGSSRSRALILHMELDDYDGQPPTAELLLPDHSPLPPQEWPKLGEGGIVHGHRLFDRPFFCRRGLREYHTHVGHEDDPWDSHREGLPLHAVVLELLDDLQKRWVGR